MVFIAFSICWSSRVPELYVTKGYLDDLLESYSSKAMPHNPFASVGYGHTRDVPQTGWHFYLKNL